MKELRAREAKALSEEDYELGKAVCMRAFVCMSYAYMCGRWEMGVG